MAEPSAPKGFEIQKYPNVQTGQDVDLYVCTRCSPPWDTFSLGDAKAHEATGVHAGEEQ